MNPVSEPASQRIEILLGLQGPKDGPHLVELRKHESPIATLTKRTHCCVGALGQISVDINAANGLQHKKRPEATVNFVVKLNISYTNLKLAANYIRLDIAGSHLVPQQNGLLPLGRILA